MSPWLGFKIDEPCKHASEKYEGCPLCRIEELTEALSIASEYLSTLCISHPHLIPHKRISESEFRLTIWDTEPPEAIKGKDDE